MKKEEKEEVIYEEVFGFWKLPDSYQGDVMRTKWGAGGKHTMKKLVAENDRSHDEVRLDERQAGWARINKKQESIMNV